MKLLLCLCITAVFYGKECHPITTIHQWSKEEKKRTEGKYFILGTLASISLNGLPHLQLVEIFHLDKNKGALFFVDNNDPAGTDFHMHPLVSLLIYFPKTHHHVLLEGKIEEIVAEEREKYWKRIPHFVKRSFLAGDNKQSLLSQNEKKKEFSKKLPKAVEVPHSLMGYRLFPTQVTFYDTNRGVSSIVGISLYDKGKWFSDCESS